MLSTAEKINFLSIQIKIQYTVTYNVLRYWEGRVFAIESDAGSVSVL